MSQIQNFELVMIQGKGKVFELYSLFLNFNRMQNDLISIDPEVIQFNRQNTQTIKITNNTTTPLNNFFFCLYNVEKFAFKPEAFSLAPKQHKLIEITLKIKTTKSIAKQFAYLKSTDVNKRLTLLINNFHSPESRTKQIEEGYSDMNTLSSRDYHQLHNRALNKIIAEQQKYLIDETANVREFNKTQNFSIGSSSKKDFYNIEMLRQIETRNVLLEKEIDDLNGLVSRKQSEIEKLDLENRFLSDQGGKLMKKISEKQTRIKELESLYDKIVAQNQEYSYEVTKLKQTVSQLEKNQQQSRLSEKLKESQISQLYKSYQSRIKDLQKVVESSERQNFAKFSKEFRKKLETKEQEIGEMRKRLEEQQIQLKQQQINCLKLENEKKILQEAKAKLQAENKDLVEINTNLREEVFVYKSRVQDSSNSKVQQYLEIALESYKNQNESLKKSKAELQKSLEGIVNTNRQSETEKLFLQNRIQALSKQLNKIEQELNRQVKLNQHLKDEHHLRVKQITEKNVILLEKIAQQNNTKRELQTSRLQKQIDLKNAQIQSLNQQINQMKLTMDDKIDVLQKQLQKIPELQEENKKLQDKVKKYKKQTKKQLKSINDNAFDELKRVHEEKKQLQKKLHRLEKTLLKVQSRARHNQHQIRPKNSVLNSKSQINEEESNNSNTSSSKQNEFNCRSKSQYEVTAQRKIGIHNQRPQLYETRSNSSKNVLLPEPVQNYKKSNDYELYELREFCAFIYNEQQRFEYIFNLHSELADPLDSNGKPLTNIKPLYKAIKFFKVIENKIKQLQEKADQSVILNRQNNFIKQKLSQLERNNNTIKEDPRKDLSAISVNNPHKQAADDEGPSFLVNRTNLTNMNVFQMIQFLKSEMKKQYNRQVENIKFLEDKYEILRKKIYREYRTRIIELVNQNASKKNKLTNQSAVSKLQNLIERFVQGLSNTTHKQAVLNKQIKIKNNFKQENSKLKQRINQLEHLLSEKHHGYCNRDPVKFFNCSTFINNPTFKEQEWMEGIKLSAQLLTHKAQNQRLKEELQIVRQDFNELKQDYDELLLKNQTKDQEMIRLKKSQLDLQKQYEKELERQNQILQQTKSKLASGGTKNKSKSSKNEERFKEKEREREIQILRAQIEKKNTQLKTFKEKEKKWEEFVNQTNRTEQKQKNLSQSYRRMQENHALIKESNRELRQENAELKETVDRLEKQLDKKKLYIKNLKGQDEQNRITKPLRIQESIQQMKELEEALKNTKQELAKAKKQKEKDAIKLESELTSAKNQALIHIRSLESVVRATLETIRKIFASFKILIKKKGLSSRLKKAELIVPENLVQINALEIYQQFQEILDVLDS